MDQDEEFALETKDMFEFLPWPFAAMEATVQTCFLLLNETERHKTGRKQHTFEAQTEFSLNSAPRLYVIESLME